MRSPAAVPARRSSECRANRKVVRQLIHRSCRRYCPRKRPDLATSCRGSADPRIRVASCCGRRHFPRTGIPIRRVRENPGPPLRIHVICTALAVEAETRMRLQTSRTRTRRSTSGHPGGSTLVDPGVKQVTAPAHSRSVSATFCWRTARIRERATATEWHLRASTGADRWPICTGRTLPGLLGSKMSSTSMSMLPIFAPCCSRPSKVGSSDDIAVGGQTSPKATPAAPSIAMVARPCRNHDLKLARIEGLDVRRG